MTQIPKIVAHFETSLSAKITAAAATASLVSVADKAGNSLSGYVGVTIDEGTTTEEECIGTLSGSTLTFSLRGLNPQDPTTEVTALKFQHRRGASVKITDAPILAIVRGLLNGELSLPSKLIYATDLTFTDDKELIPKKYADALAIAGAPDATTTLKGLFKASVAPASPTSPIAVGDNDPRVPTQAENDAIAGKSGTAVGSANKLIDEAYFYNAGYFGNGVDGALVYDGSTTILGMAPAANVYTLTRDIFATDITVNNGITLNPGGYRIYANGTLTNNGTIARNGNAGTNGSAGSVQVDGSFVRAAAGVGGAALADGTLGGSPAGVGGGLGSATSGNGGDGTSGTAVSNVTEGSGAQGGTGGTKSGAAVQSPGNGGAVGAGTLAIQGIKVVLDKLFDYSGIMKSRAGSSGGGGGATGYNNSGGSSAAGGGGGGGSGSNGGTIMIAAKIIINNGSKVISANGGAGGAGGAGSGPGTSSTAGGGGGGGAGGSGGLIVLIYRTLTNSGSITVTGGAAGAAGAAGSAGSSAGNAGSVGNAGGLYQIQMN